MELVPRLGSGIPLQARVAEMDLLRAAQRQAADGTPTAVLLAGDAGVGKSRLVAELVRHAASDGAMTLVGHCLESGEGALPYLPFSEALGQLGAAHAAELESRPALGRLLRGLALPVEAEFSPVAPVPRATRSGGDRDAGQLQLFDAVLGLLTDLAQRQTVLLVVEDLHWADESSRNLLHFLVARLRAQRLLILATYRTDDLHRRHPLRPLLTELVRSQVVERVDLGPLAVADTRAFVAALADEPLSEAVAEQVVARSEGNPFFVEELLATCVDCGEEMPAALADVLLARMERLSATAQEVVRLASVHGRRIRHTALQAVAEMGGPELDAAVREAVQLHVLVVDGDMYSFRHALLREAVYGDLLPGERVRLHARYAAALACDSGPGVAAALAHHSLQSHALPQALAASVAASKEAERQAAPAEALRHIEQALQLWDAVPAEQRPADVDEVGLLRKASVMCQGSGAPERSISYARGAVAKADGLADAELAAASRWRLAAALLAVEDPDCEAPSVIEHAWQLVADLPASRIRVWVLAVHAELLRKSDVAQARRMAALALTDARTIGIGGAEAEALTTIGLLDDMADRPSEARANFQAAAQRAAAADSWSPELRAHCMLSLHHLERGQLRPARAACESGVERAMVMGMTWSTYGLELRVLRIVLAYLTGDWDAGETAAEPPGRHVSDTVALRVAAAALHVQVGRGRFAEAAELLRTLRPDWARDSQIAYYAGGCGAEIALWQGDAELAIARIDDLLDWFAKLGESTSPPTIRVAALALSAHADLAGRAPEVGLRHRQAADELLAHAEAVAVSGRIRSGSLGPEGRAWLAMARAEHSRVEGGAGSVAAWRAAVKAFGYGEIYRRAVARWRYAAALLAAGDRQVAATELTAAGEVARKLEATPLADAVAGLARRARLSTGTGQASGSDPLTPRERSVLELVARGRTNREAGEELYISEKTVSVHLSRVMAKLGVTRRAEAVATAYERGLLEG
ncbi:MAG: helix-turn-helix transcriptional regulator [Sciscionella sp.]